MELYLLPILSVLTLILFTFVVTWFFQQRVQREKVRKALLDLNKSLEALWGVEEKILGSLNFEEVVDKIANIVLTELNYLQLGYVIVVLALIDKEEDVLRRISLSSTPEAQIFLKEFRVRFRDIIIPLDQTDNLGIKAIKEKRPFVTHDVSDLLYPAMRRDYVRDLQKKVGIETSLVFPIFSRSKVIGIIIFSMKKGEKEISPMEWSVLKSFTGAVGISVENAQLFEEVQATSEELHQANEKLKELDKLKDEFVSVASHELRTPMTAIKSYLWMALAGRGGELTEKQKYYLDRSYASTDRLIKLVNDMLNVSRIESGRITLEMQAVKMDKLADDVITEVTPRAQELDIGVSRQSPKDLPEVLADPDKIKEVMMNLIGNSLKFTQRGGEIKISFAVKNGMVETSVADTGRGIAKEDLAKLFKKFGLIEGTYVTTQQDGGTGLGLYISKSIVELHQGKIWVESKGIGKGATFTFSLPVFKKRDLEKIKKEQEGKETVGLIHTAV